MSLHVLAGDFAELLRVARLTGFSDYAQEGSGTVDSCRSDFSASSRFWTTTRRTSWSPGPSCAALLVMLALQCGRAVPADQLVDALWGPDSSAAARNGLQGLVSKLRRALGSASLVATRGGGYALEVPPEAVDVHRFEQLVAAGRAMAVSGNLESAIELLADADSLWRGEALPEFAYEEFAAAEVSRLSELRLAAVEERLDIELQLGRHRGVIGELESLVAAHPLRERLRGLLMIALYRSGRQADALRTFQEGRRILGEELGLDPGPELRQLEAAILAQDPSLDVPDARQVASTRASTAASLDRSGVPHAAGRARRPRSATSRNCSATIASSRSSALAEWARRAWRWRWLATMSAAPVARGVSRRAGARRRSGRGASRNRVGPRPA